ncbi:MAG: hypothetical protein ABJ205_00340 [Erythrobacter sp.]|uniref:hypothetical protein n=1 Tax=Erythrobacter sp. TaxID=1042 RepID=UPI003266DD23
MAGALLLGGCGAEDVAPDYRYRLTVEVDTPEGLKTGSSVIEVSTKVAKRGTVIVNGAMRMRAR